MLRDISENGLASDGMTLVSSFMSICPLVPKLIGQEIHCHEISISMPFLRKSGQQAINGLYKHSTQDKI
jgi:hypothetical protein